MLWQQQYPTVLPAKEPPAYVRLRTMTSDVIQCPTMDEQHGSTHGHVQPRAHPQATGKPRQKSLRKRHANGPRASQAMAAVQVLHVQPRRALGTQLLHKKCTDQLSHR